MAHPPNVPPDPPMTQSHYTRLPNPSASPSQLSGVSDQNRPRRRGNTQIQTEQVVSLHSLNYPICPWQNGKITRCWGQSGIIPADVWHRSYDKSWARMCRCDTSVWNATFKWKPSLQRSISTFKCTEQHPRSRDVLLVGVYFCALDRCSCGALIAQAGLLLCTQTNKNHLSSCLLGLWRQGHCMISPLTAPVIRPISQSGD